jgi:hypothetical protein
LELDYTVDDTARLIHASVAGPFDRDVFLDMLERMRAEGTWSYGTLLDLRGLTGLPSFDDLRQIARVATRTDSERQHRGPLAILTEDAALFGMACTYAAMSTARDVDVFSDASDADLWLLLRAPATTR